MNITKKRGSLFIDWKDLIRYINNPAIHEMIKMIQQLCDIFAYRPYIVGGFVRDFLLGKPNNDIDIVIEGNALNIGQALSKYYGVSFIAYPHFLTGTIKLNKECSIDFITARSEYYQSPGSLPIVKASDLFHDLGRRDFSINSMAIQMDKKDCGRMIDYFEGLQDLQHKRIRILHDLSFYDDPTRIFRAIKFENRYDFHIEVNTSRFMVDVINKGIMKRVSKERLKNEIFSLLTEEKAFDNMQKLTELELLQSLYPYIEFDTDRMKPIQYINKTAYDSLFCNHIEIDDVLVKLLILFSKCPVEYLDRLKKDLCLNKYYGDSFTRMLKYKENVFHLLNEVELSNYQLFQLFQDINREVLLALYYMAHHDTIRHKILHYIQNLRHVKLEINGRDLARFNIKPGKIYGYIMDQVLKAKLSSEIDGYEEELQYISKLLRSMND